jgi:hypothetical protein
MLPQLTFLNFLSHLASLFNTYLNSVNHVSTLVSEERFGLFDIGQKDMERHAAVGRGGLLSLASV